MVNFKKGTGTFLEFTIAGIILTSILLFLIRVFAIQYTSSDFNLYADQIARSIVVCDSLSEAQTLANDMAQEFIKSDNKFNDMNVSISYVPGSKQIWEKGTFINIEVTANSNENITTITVMVE